MPKVLVSVIFYVLQLCSLSYSASISERHPNSLFNLIKFPNEACGTSSLPQRSGTCLTTSECESQKGSVDGDCAAGFGVCCVLSISTCGESVIRNTTYIQNPGFPATFALDTTNECTYYFPRSMDGICSIRLDFRNLRLKNADTTNGDCGTEFFMAKTGTRVPLPEFCGDLSGQHMYLTSGSQTENLGSLTLKFDTTSDPRMWDILVNMIPCQYGVVPPMGCLQYFTEPAGTFRNYNFGTLIRNTAYNICFRRAEGFCRIMYTVNEAESNVSPFSLGDAMSSKTTIDECRKAQLRIMSSLSENPDNVYCGNKLNTFSNQNVNAAITSDVKPFVLGLITAEDAVPTSTGFKLNYLQIPCT